MRANWIVTVIRLDGTRMAPYKRRMGHAPREDEIFVAAAVADRVKVQIIVATGPIEPKKRTDTLGTWQVTAHEIPGLSK